MIRAGLAAALLCGAATLAPGAHGAFVKEAELEQSRGFCAARPLEPDRSLPTAVNALGITTETAPIAILGTGVDASVPEIAGRVVSPFDALGGSPDGNDVDGHGTQLAGLAAGGAGMVQGVSPASPVMPVRIFSPTGTSTTKALVDGLRWAVDHGASAVAIAGSEPLAEGSAADVQAISRGISEAFNKGVMVFAGTGNEGAQQANLPAALPHVFAVGASDTLGNRATFSNTGSWVDVVAPGSAMTAPMPVRFCDSGYGLANGTSYGAPAAAAAGALLAKLRPELTVQQRFEVLRTSARDASLPGRDDETGFGMLDVGAALSKPAPAKDASPEVDDDPFFVRGPFASGHPVLLGRGRKATRAGQLSRSKDPADVYRVRVKKGERLVARAKAKLAESVFELAFWKPGAGDFDVSNDVAKNRIVSTGGFANDPELKMRVTRTGTYFVSIEATDLIDEDEDPTTPVPISEAYTLSVSKTKLKTRATPKPKRKQTTTKR